MAKVVVDNLVQSNEDVPSEAFEIYLTPERILTALMNRNEKELMYLLEDIVLEEVANKYNASLIDFSMEVQGNEGFSVYFPPLDG